MIKRSIFLFLILTVIIFGSDGMMDLLEKANKVIADFKSTVKINTREIIFTVRVDISDSRITLTGETSNGDLKDKLVSELIDTLKVSVEDKVTVLPQDSLGEKIFAIVKVPVVNLMDGPRKTSQKNAVTQARMGEILKLLKQNDGWYLAQMEDSYLGWIDGENLWIVDKTNLDDYLSNRFALVISKFADIYSKTDKTQLQEKIVQGTVLPYLKTDNEWALIQLPGREKVYVKSTDLEFFNSREEIFSSKKDAFYIINIAKQHLGLPYLWAGTTSFGFDCSGFTQFCFKMAGYFLRRDADMQFEQGEVIESKKDLQPGDLVFFQTYKPGPSHVGIYIGNMKYIHSGSNGVAINSFDPNSPDYSQSLDQKYIGARRILHGGE